MCIRDRSGAIAEYILERHKNGGLKPASDDPRFPEYLQWFHYCEGMVMPPVNTIVVHTILLPPERQDETVRGQAERLLAKAWAPVEAAMERREYLIGDFSAADTMLGHACIIRAFLSRVSLSLATCVRWVMYSGVPQDAMGWTRRRRSRASRRVGERRPQELKKKIKRGGPTVI